MSFVGTLVHIRPEALRILAVAWGLERLIQGERHITRNGKAVESGINQGLFNSHVSESSNVRCDKSLQRVPSPHPGQSS